MSRLANREIVEDGFGPVAATCTGSFCSATELYQSLINLVFFKVLGLDRRSSIDILTKMMLSCHKSSLKLIM